MQGFISAGCGSRPVKYLRMQVLRKAASSWFGAMGWLLGLICWRRCLSWPSFRRPSGVGMPYQPPSASKMKIGEFSGIGAAVDSNQARTRRSGVRCRSSSGKRVGSQLPAATMS